MHQAAPGWARTGLASSNENSWFSTRPLPQQRKVDFGILYIILVSTVQTFWTVPPIPKTLLSYNTILRQISRQRGASAVPGLLPGRAVSRRGTHKAVSPSEKPPVSNALVAVLGAPSLSSQRLCSPMGFPSRDANGNEENHYSGSRSSTSAPARAATPFKGSGGRHPSWRPGAQSTSTHANRTTSAKHPLQSPSYTPRIPLVF